LTDESNDEAVPNNINKDPFNPFGHGELATCGHFASFRKTFRRMNIVLTELGDTRNDEIHNQVLKKVTKQRQFL
jgi:hypothetical protein